MLERTSRISGSLLSAGHSHKASERADVLREEHLNNKNLPHNHHGSLARGDIPQTGHLPDHVKMDFQVLADSKHQAAQHNPPMVCTANI